MLSPGDDGEPLPGGALLVRIGKDSHLNRVARERPTALAEMFELSSEDKEADRPCLSIWVEGMTIADQAWAFMGGKPVNTVVACLSIDEIRAIPRKEPFDALDVVWERAKWPDGTINSDPGSEGHCGITGLKQGSDGKMDGKRRKSLRLALADAAKISPVPVPHDIPKGHLEVAAYFIAENGELPEGGCDQHWVAAVRQLRRARVREHKEST